MKPGRKIWPLFLLFTPLFIWAASLNYEVPILMYHHVGNAGVPTGLNVSTKTFERQMEFLKAHRYNVIPLRELVDKTKAGQKFPMNTVVITFDDGYLDNFTDAFPALKKMGFPATIFMISGNVGQENSLSEEDLRILDGSGITIGSHTVNHAFLPKLGRAEAEKEITESKAALEKILGHPVLLFSYPAGGVTRETRAIVADSGYEGAVTTNYGDKRGDVYALRRIKVSEANGNLFNFWAKVSGFYRIGKKTTKMEEYSGVAE